MYQRVAYLLTVHLFVSSTLRFLLVKIFNAEPNNCVYSNWILWHVMQLWRIVLIFEFTQSREMLHIIVCVYSHRKVQGNGWLWTPKSSWMIMRSAAPKTQHSIGFCSTHTSNCLWVIINRTEMITAASLIHPHSLKCILYNLLEILSSSFMDHWYKPEVRICKWCHWRC